MKHTNKLFLTLAGIFLISLIALGAKIGENELRLGAGTDVDIVLKADNGDTNLPALKYNSSANAWQASNDGVSFEAFGAVVTEKRPTALNLGIFAATTTNANDSIKISSADGSALSASNKLIVIMRSVSSGQLTTFEVTSDVTIDLTGAPFGAGGAGDLVDQKLVVYAVNRAGNIEFAVGTLSQIIVVRDAIDVTVPASATSAQSVLITGALAADANSLMLGWVHANFDDAGGAAPDLWSVQTGTGDIFIGYQDIPISIHFNSNAGQSVLNNTVTVLDFKDNVHQTHPGLVTIGSSWLFTIPVTGLWDVKTNVVSGGLAGWVAGERVELTITAPTGGGEKYTNVTTMHASHGSVVAASVSGDVNLVVDDTLRVTLFQNNGATLGLDGSGPKVSISITKIGD